MNTAISRVPDPQMAQLQTNNSSNQLLLLLLLFGQPKRLQ